MSFRRYQRPFVKPLRTARGEWLLREGLIVRIECDSGVEYGEVAPIPEFGTETLAVAEAFLQSLTANNEFPENTADLDAFTLECQCHEIAESVQSMYQ